MHRHVEQARGCALVVLVAKSSLEKMDFSTPDGDYMTKGMKGLRVFVSEFNQLVIDLLIMEGGDRWPSDSEDKAAQGMPKDGAVLVQLSSMTKTPTQAATKILGLKAPCRCTTLR